MSHDAEQSSSRPTSSFGVDTVAASVAALAIDGEKKPLDRPPFYPSAQTASSPLLDRLTGQPGSTGETWRISLVHDVHFSRSGFFSAVKDLALHPERNSSVILRGDPLPPRPPLRTATSAGPSSNGQHDEAFGRSAGEDGVALDEEAVWLGMERREELRLRLMPKQVKRDGKLDQRIAIYQSRGLGGSEGQRAELDRESDEREKSAGEQAMVLMMPEVKTLEDIPFYHPPVSNLAFLYESLGGDEQRIDPNAGIDSSDVQDTMPIRGRIYIAYLPFPALTSDQAQSQHVREVPTNPLLNATRRTPPKRRSPLSQSSAWSSEDQAAPPPAAVIHPSSPKSSVNSRPVRNGQGESVPATPIAADQTRLERTLRALFEKVYKYGYNSITPYQKRVHHDALVQKESFQDLYLELKERHRHLESRAPKPGSTKVEDVKRHVWKAVDMSTPSDPTLPVSDVSHWGSQDLAIAAFLMLIWKDMYPAQESVEKRDDAMRRWDTWGRPSGGFVDLGCGNGLLVHILTSEGYAGKGYELRARRTWPLYPPETRAALVELPIEFPTWFPDSNEEWDNGSWEGKDNCPLREECFIIGNHADEITPWIPLLSLIPLTPVPFLSLPCCFHTLDGPFTTLNFTPPPHPHSPPGNFAGGFEDGQSRYKSYIMWLGWYGLMCGWEWEKESLRIPSTKGWAIVALKARNRSTSTAEELRQCRIWALGQVTGVRARGAFKVREREGREH